ncbi:EIF4a-1-family RNA SFII helicase [Cryptosporidium ubiquitum]|uniref:RNA helicase n=1 Tax=Cryptosporidium ubiquitum TaxID=857276 RepID=A0A1J4MG32_9CRYT|nr:EIF4a-1-family RNA SFII helicase [Cryptosporidium ubiquitum]OII73218.1 EIF4a-1-family RNA SFII helicase [Cryptosporidium ubiquitum]
MNCSSFSVLALGTSFTSGRKSRELWEKISNEKARLQEYDNVAENLGKEHNDSKGETTVNEDYIVNKRNSMNIAVDGDNKTPPLLTFNEMKEHGNLPNWVLDNIKSILKYQNPTAIQSQAIPLLFSGVDLLVQSPTGSGKTLCYILPILGRLRNEKVYCANLILSPTRELAQQIVREIKIILDIHGKKYRCRYISGKIDKVQESNTKRLDIAVSTPYRLADICRNNIINLQGCSMIVLDEVDKLLDMGFAPQIDEILSHSNIPKGGKVQIAAFSATLPQNVINLADSIMKSPIKVTLGHRLAASSTIIQELVCVTKDDAKIESLRQLIKQGKIMLPTLVFTNSKDDAQRLFKKLMYDNLIVEAIHSDMPKVRRDNIIQRFRTGKIWILICTDLMARGVDFKNVSCVVNYDFPHSPINYIHRVGRCGRAGRTGYAITFFTLRDIPKIKSIAKVIKSSGADVPSWMLKVKLNNINKSYFKKQK